MNDSLCEQVRAGQSRLNSANLTNANLRSAFLHTAYLSNSDLSGAGLEGATLKEAILQGANFHGTKLSSANFGYTDLTGVIKLTQEQLDDAFGNIETKLPDGFSIEIRPLDPGDKS